MTTLDSPVLSIGAGNMAHAILQGAQHASLLTPTRIGVLDPNNERRALFPNAFDAHERAASWLAARDGDRPLVMIAVKPQMLQDALPPMVKAAEDAGVGGCTWVSILAGTTAEAVRGMVRAQDSVVRVMPNTPAQLGMGMSAIAHEGVSEDDLHRVRALFTSVGEVIEIPESLMDAFTAVAGSGPAYLFYLAEGMERAAKEIGFTPEQASLIVRQTLQGSANLLEASDEDPGTLRSRVTSKNGTTHAATTTLDDGGVMGCIVEALTAARDRGRSLGRV